MTKHLFLASYEYIIVAKADEKTVPREPVSLFFWQIGHRHYDPDEPWNFDPSHPSGTNAYVYCYNDPITFFDNTGHLPDWAKWLIGGAQTVVDQTAKILYMASLNPGLTGKAFDWLLGGWFYL